MPWSCRSLELASKSERTGELQLKKTSFRNDGTKEKERREPNVPIDAFFVFCDLSDTKKVTFFQRYVSLTRGLCLLGELPANFKSEEARRSLTKCTEGWIMWAGDSCF